MAENNHDKQTEEMKNGTIEINEEQPAAQAETQDWIEEFSVATNEIMDFMRKLSHEAGIRRIVIKNEQHDLHWEVPLVFGVAGIIMLPAAVTMLGLATALMTECKIYVERVEPAEKAAETKEKAAS